MQAISGSRRSAKSHFISDTYGASRDSLYFATLAASRNRAE
jgi:hypothetical protein